MRGKNKNELNVTVRFNLNCFRAVNWYRAFVLSAVYVTVGNVVFVYYVSKQINLQHFLSLNDVSIYSRQPMIHFNISVVLRTP